MNDAQKTLDLLEAGKINDAHTQFEVALKTESAEMLYNLAQRLSDYGFNDWAQITYRKLLAAYPDEDELRVNLAELLIADGKDDQALNLLAAVKPDSAAYVAALMTSADLYQTQGLFEVSEAKLKQAQRLAYDEPIVTFALAELYFNQKKFSQAKDLYLSLIKDGQLRLAGVNLVARLGVSYASMGQFDHAIAYLSQIASDQLDDDVLFELGFTELQLNDYDNAIKHLVQLRKRNPNYTTLYLPLAQAYENQGQINTALKTLQEGLALDHYDEKLLLAASQLALKVGDDALAMRYLKQAHEQHPENLAILSQLAEGYCHKHDYQSAIDLIDAAGQTASQDPQLAWLLGQSWWHLGDFEKAKPNYQLAQSQLGDSDFIADAAAFYRQAGDLAQAKKLVKHGLINSPNDAQLLDLAQSLDV